MSAVKAFRNLMSQAAESARHSPSAHIEHVSLSLCEDGRTVLAFVELTNGHTLTACFEQDDWDDTQGEALTAAFWIACATARAVAASFKCSPPSSAAYQPRTARTTARRTTSMGQ